MFQRLTTTLLALALSIGTAHAATVGSFTFDDNAFADDAMVALTIPGTRGPAQSPASAADGDLSTASNLNDSFVELFFTDNVLINGPGDDIVIFSNSNNNVIRLWAGLNNGPWTTGIGSTIVPVDAPGNTSGFGIAAATIDLSTLGYADGAEITDGIYLARGGVFTTVWDVAALNSRDTTPPPPSTVPLPAGIPLLFSALVAFAFLRRRHA